MRVSLLFAGAVMILAACASRTASHAAHAPAKNELPSRPVGAARISPETPSAERGLPAGLTGVWHKRFQGGDQKMALQPGRFRFYVDPASAATGTLTVIGHDVTYSNSDTCPGTGTYRFALAGAALRLVAVGDDPCPRAAFMTGAPWTRSS